MAKSFAPVVSPTLCAATIADFGKAKKKLDAVIESADVTRSKAVNKLLDAMLLACDQPKDVFMKGNAATNAARQQVKKLFDDIVEKKFLEKSTASTYQTCFWIAFEHGIEWTPSLANKKTADTKNAGAGADEKTPKNGIVEKTDIPALHKTLSKALAQARLLNQTLFAADLVDLITDTWPDFKETILSK